MRWWGRLWAHDGRSVCLVCHCEWCRSVMTALRLMPRLHSSLSCTLHCTPALHHLLHIALFWHLCCFAHLHSKHFFIGLRTALLQWIAHNIAPKCNELQISNIIFLEWPTLHFLRCCAIYLYAELDPGRMHWAELILQSSASAQNADWSPRGSAKRPICWISEKILILLLFEPLMVIKTNYFDLRPKYIVWFRNTFWGNDQKASMGRK